MRNRGKKRAAEFNRLLKKRAAKKNRATPPIPKHFAIREYYQQAFLEFVAILGSGGYSPAHSRVRNQFWRDVPPRTYSGDEASDHLEHYLQKLDSTLKAMIEQHSIAYWLHIYRRFAPTPIGRNKKAATICHTRACLDAAIQKYGKAELCTGIALSDQVPDSAILRGYLKSRSPEVLAEIRKLPQLVLTDFGVAEYREALEVEKLAYEVWWTMAQLRIVGKGAPMCVTGTDECVYDDRSDELDLLVTNFDARSQVFGTTATATAFEGLGKSVNGMIVLPQWNAEMKTFESLRPLFEFFIKRPLANCSGGPNFVWQPFSFISYYEAHRPFGESFRALHSVSLEAVLGIVATLATTAMMLWQRHPLEFLFRSWQRAYEGPVRPELIKESLALAMPDVLPGFGLPVDLVLSELDAAFDFLSLSAARRENVDLGYSGPHSVFLPCGSEHVFTDFANLESWLFYLFHGVKVSDQNFKGSALEAITHRGKSILPTSGMRGADSTSKQVDAAFGIGDILVICECRAVSRAITFERGNIDALAKRKEVIDKSLRDIDDKGRWLVAHPSGSNYDITSYRYILPIGVTPFIEFIPSRAPQYWISERYPRVLSPYELETLLRSDGFTRLAKECTNTLRR